jgi:hypothetical protein
MNKFLVLLTIIVFLPMNVYSRALRHVDMNDVKQKHHRKLMERKIREERKRELIEELTYKNSPLYSNWREEISEGMTTSDVFSTTLPATGETTLSTYEYDVTFGPNSNDPDTFAAAGGLIYDTRYYDTVVFDLSPGTGSLVIGFFTIGSDQGIFYSVPSSAGTYTITIPDEYRIPSVAISWISSGSEGQTTGYGNWRVSDIRFQRRSPMNVFVPLDSPEATSFIRTGSGDLSPEEKQERIKEMLEASDEYVQKMYGDEFPGSGAVPPGESGTTPGVEIAQVYPSDYDKERAVDQMLLKGLQRGDYGTGPQIDKQIRQLQKNLQQGTPGGLPLA